MQELLKSLAAGLVNDPDAVKVTVDEPNEDGVVVYHLSVAADDMGRVIGNKVELQKQFALLCVQLLTVMMKKLW